MIYLKSVASGIAGSLLAVILMAVIEAVVFGLAVAGRDRSSGGIAVVLLPVFPVVVAGAVGFAVGFWWQFRKRSHGVLDRGQNG